jgi:hypothetical protein
MSDRLSLAHAIEDAGIPREKAEGVATAIARFVEGAAATKADLDRVGASLKADIVGVETSLKAEIAKVETGLRAEIARVDAKVGLLDAKVEQVGSRTFNRLGTLVVVVATLLFAALHLWPAHG